MNKIKRTIELIEHKPNGSSARPDNTPKGWYWRVKSGKVVSEWIGPFVEQRDAALNAAEEALVAARPTPKAKAKTKAAAAATEPKSKEAAK